MYTLVFFLYIKSNLRQTGITTLQILEYEDNVQLIGFSQPEPAVDVLNHQYPTLSDET